MDDLTGSSPVIRRRHLDRFGFEKYAPTHTPLCFRATTLVIRRVARGCHLSSQILSESRPSSCHCPRSLVVHHSCTCCRRSSEAREASRVARDVSYVIDGDDVDGARRRTRRRPPRGCVEDETAGGGARGGHSQAARPIGCSRSGILLLGALSFRRPTRGFSPWKLQNDLDRAASSSRRKGARDVPAGVPGDSATRRGGRT